MEFLSGVNADLLRFRGSQASESRARSAAAVLERARKGEGNADRAGLREAAQGLEAFFIFMMLKAMRKTIQKSDVFGDRKKEETYVGLMDMELTKDLARAGGIGLTPLIMADFERTPLGVERKTNVERGPFPVHPGAGRGASLGGQAASRGAAERKEFFWRRPVEGRLSSMGSSRGGVGSPWGVSHV